MRKLVYIPFLCCLFLLNVAGTCSDEDERPSTVRVNNLITLASQGTWKVTNLEVNNENITDSFSGYNLTFGATNALDASRLSVNVPGTWAVFNDKDNILNFNITFDNPQIFTNFNHDWTIASSSSTKIVLENISNTIGRSDYLTLEKN